VGVLGQVVTGRRAAASLLAVMLTASALAVPASAAAAGAVVDGWHSVAVIAPPGAPSNPEAQLDGIACPSATECVAGGFYQNSTGGTFPMVATESHGRWGRAMRLHLPAIAGRSQAAVSDVACWAVGSCIALGQYVRATTVGPGFVVTESKGSWGHATILPLPANAAAHLQTQFFSAACTGAGSCVAVGSYVNSADSTFPVVVTESHGRWLQAQQVRPPANSSRDPEAQLIGVACQATGSCVAVGSYEPRTGPDRGLEVTESDGTWHRGTTALPPAGIEPKLGNYLIGVSCWSASCTAVGGYSASNGDTHPMAVSYRTGRWYRGVPLRGVPRGVRPQPLVQIDSVACTAAGCTAAGEYTGASPRVVPVAVSESGGRWKRAVPVALPPGHSTGLQFVGFLHAIACYQRTCTAVGFFVHTPFRVLAVASTYR
jgi:hypothetical protein